MTEWKPGDIGYVLSTPHDSRRVTVARVTKTLVVDNHGARWSIRHGRKPGLSAPLPKLVRPTPELEAEYTAKCNLRKLRSLVGQNLRPELVVRLLEQFSAFELESP